MKSTCVISTRVLTGRQIVVETFTCDYKLSAVKLESALKVVLQKWRGHYVWNCLSSEVKNVTNTDKITEWNVFILEGELEEWEAEKRVKFYRSRGKENGEVLNAAYLYDERLQEIKYVEPVNTEL